ncbi:beta-lactamase family protein [Eubacteriales bacterium OttesenSCG-928-A19]|nr:beta-lactamase family protein [Eubacteriales bacterium OttesenSCG-928-A19]
MNNRHVPDTRALREAVAETAESFHRKGYFPSAVISVFTPDAECCRVTVGGARADTVYDVASLTKIATATQVLRLIDAGCLSLDDGILDVLPALSEHPILADRLRDVTVASLLTHTSGIVDWYPFYVEKGDFARVLAIALERYGPVEGMVYSDLNFMLLGKAIEACRGGLPLEECLRRELVAPLSLGRMTYRPDLAWDIAPSSYGNPIEESMCAERGLRFDGWRPHAPVRGEANDGNAYYYFGGVAGSAGIFADVDAYRALGQYHLNAGSPLLHEAMREQAPTRGYGWQLGEMYPQGCGHTGFTGTSIYLSRALGVGVVAFTNRLYYPEANPNATNDFRRALHERVAGLFA